MWKLKYMVNYTVRPNKNGQGTYYSRAMTFTGKDQSEVSIKMMKVLSALHRVNVEAIIVHNFKHLKTTFHLKEWLTKTVGKFFKGAFELFQHGGNFK